MQTIDQVLVDLEVQGYSVLERVIPADRVTAVRESVYAAHQIRAEEANAKAQAVRAQGHRLAAAGVQAVPGIINDDQSFAPYVADERIMGAVERLFGAFTHITNVSAMVNFPGNDRAYWHADWPYNQTNAAHIPAPYPDAVIKLSSIWMLTEFNQHTGGTLVLPGSHRTRTNPSGGELHDREAPHPAEVQISGDAGSVMLFDSRLWHCVTTNHSDQPRVALNVGYAPWWLNLQPQKEGTAEFQQMVVEMNGKPNVSPPIPGDVYDSLPEKVKPLVRHMVA